MKKILSLFFFTVLFVNSCKTTNHSTVKQPVRKPRPTVTNTGTSISPAAQTEREYQALIKTYKPETTAVLNSLLNDSSKSTEVAISVENKSK